MHLRVTIANTGPDHSRYLPIGGFFVLQAMLSNTLAFQKNIEGFALFLRDLKLSDNLMTILHDLDCLIRPIFLAVSALVVGFMFLSNLVSWRSCGILVPWFLVQKGLQNYLRDCFETASDVPGSLLPSFWFLCCVKKEVLTISLTFSPTVFLVEPSFLLLCRGK